MISIETPRLPNKIGTKTVSMTAKMLEEILARFGYDGSWNLVFFCQVKQKSSAKFKVVRRDSNSIRVRTKPGGNDTAWECILTPPKGFLTQECFENLRQVHPEKLFVQPTLGTINVPLPRVNSPLPKENSPVTAVPEYLSGIHGCGHMGGGICRGKIVETVNIKGETYATCTKHMNSMEWITIVNLSKREMKESQKISQKTMEAHKNWLRPVSQSTTVQPKPVAPQDQSSHEKIPLEQFVVGILYKDEYKEGISLDKLVSMTSEQGPRIIRDGKILGLPGSDVDRAVYGILAKLSSSTPPVVEKTEDGKYKVYLHLPEPEEKNASVRMTNSLELGKISLSLSPHHEGTLRENKVAIDYGLIAAALVMTKHGIAGRTVVTKSIQTRLGVDEYVTKNKEYKNSTVVVREITVGMCNLGYIERIPYNCEKKDTKPTTSEYKITERGRARLEALKKLGLSENLSQQLFSMYNGEEIPEMEPQVETKPIPEESEEDKKKKVAENLSILAPLVQNHDDLARQCDELSELIDGFKKDKVTHQEAIDGLHNKVSLKKEELKRLQEEIDHLMGRIVEHNQAIQKMDTEIENWEIEKKTTLAELEKIKDQLRKTLA